MSRVLNDGTVIMSNLGVRSTASRPPTGTSQTDLGVRIGEVIGAEYPEETGLPEVVYLVQVRRRDGAGPEGSLTWRCRLASNFEGVADYSRATLRPATKQVENKLVNDGAKVLVAAVNGDISQAFIIGCVKQAMRKDRPRKKPKKVNREYEAEFNGVHFYVEDDGSFSVQVPGATAQDGSPDPERDQNNHGTRVRFDKSGDVTLSDENGESLRISPKEKLVEVLTGDYHVKATGKLTMESKLDALLQTEASATITASGNARLDGNKIYIGSATAKENLVLGRKLVEALQALVDEFLKVAPAISTQGNLGYPVPLNPALVQALMRWRTQYLTGDVASILAKNKYTERN